MALLHPYEIEEIEARFGPRLWDAGDVCCAAYQLGACEHTEAYDEDDIEELLAMTPDTPVVAAVAATVVEEPF